jgi:flagellar hook assembly protein FlgD
VYDVSGRLVRRIDSGVYPAGHRVATWDGRDEHGRDVAPGIYFVQAKGDLGYRRTMKISVLR